MKKNFTRFFALVASVVVPSMAMAELAYNVPFAEADWNNETTIVASKGSNEWSSKHGICLGDNGLGGFDYSDKYVVLNMRSHIAFYLKKYKIPSETRVKLLNVLDLNELIDLLKGIFRQ